MIKPIADRLVVKEIKSAETKTGAGIILTEDDKQSRHKEGTVLAVGRGRVMEPRNIDVAGMGAYQVGFYPMETKVGDTIVFTFGDEYTIDGEKMYIIKESDVLAIK